MKRRDALPLIIALLALMLASASLVWQAWPTPAPVQKTEIQRLREKWAGQEEYSRREQLREQGAQLEDVQRQLDCLNHPRRLIC